jgi:hypothetical protein
VEGLGGGRIYSENCYAALSRKFSWARLDQCGGFDVGAVAIADDGAEGTGSDMAYFGSEAAATRYLQAAVSGGAPPGEADQRLAALQSAMARFRPTPRPSAAGAEEFVSPKFAAETSNAAQIEVTEDGELLEDGAPESEETPELIEG